MKLILAVVNNDDSSMLSSTLTTSGYSATKLATTGGFLRAGNTTLLVCVYDEKVDDVLDIISKCCKKRTQIAPASSAYGMEVYASYPVEVTVGGATVFVVNVDQFIKL